MRAGLERCRNCGKTDDLTFEHIVPFSKGGRYNRADLTILCRRCNMKRGNWSKQRGLISLAEEEQEFGVPPWPDREGATPEVLALIELNTRLNGLVKAKRARRAAENEQA